MRRVLGALSIVLTAALPVAAGDAWIGRRGDPRADLFVEVPLDYDTSVRFPFGGSHHAVPGVVTINDPAPYYCGPHARSFRTRAAFVEHLAVKHGLNDREIPTLVIVDRNQVRYVGD
jgi:hypothetical protein